MTGGLALVLGVLLASAGGFAWVACAFGTAARTPQEWLGRLALGAIVGLGALSLFTFVWLFAADGFGPVYPFADALACALLAGAALALRRTRAGLRLPALERGEVLIALALLVAFALATWRFAAATRVMPHGEWDAWEVWNYRARELFRAGPAWRAAFAPGIKSSEYPLLLPLASARLWAFGGESPLAPALVAGIFTLGGAWIVAALVGGLSGSLAGATAALLLLGTSGYQWWGAEQYGDVPLATYLVAAAGVLMLARARGERSAALVALAGVLLGLAGWTKTDGTLAALLASIVFLAAEARSGGRARVVPALSWICAGAALPALAWLVQHVVLAPELAPVLAQPGAASLAKLGDPGRWTAVVAALVRRAPGAELALPLVAPAIALLQGLRPRALVRSAAFWLAAALVLVDVLVFVETPLELDFHLLTAGDRLLLQAWPLYLLALFGGIGRRDGWAADQ